MDARVLPHSGDFAHGKLVTQQPRAWNPLEHLVLATIAFPLVVKVLLERRGYYQPTDADTAQIDIFERFADTADFVRRPADQRNGTDSHWGRLFGKRKVEVMMSRGAERAVKAAEEKLKDIFGDDTGAANA